MPQKYRAAGEQDKEYRQAYQRYQERCGTDAAFPGAGRENEMYNHYRRADDADYV